MAAATRLEFTLDDVYACVGNTTRSAAQVGVYLVQRLTGEHVTWGMYETADKAISRAGVTKGRVVKALDELVAQGRVRYLGRDHPDVRKVIHYPGYITEEAYEQALAQYETRQEQYLLRDLRAKAERIILERNAEAVDNLFEVLLLQAKEGN